MALKTVRPANTGARAWLESLQTRCDIYSKHLGDERARKRLVAEFEEDFRRFQVMQGDDRSTEMTGAKSIVEDITRMAARASS